MLNLMKKIICIFYCFLQTVYIILKIYLYTFHEAADNVTNRFICTISGEPVTRNHELVGTSHQ